MSKPDLFLLDDTLWVLAAPTGVPIYDFDFLSFFPGKHHRPKKHAKDETLPTSEYIKAVARCGAFDTTVDPYCTLLGNAEHLVFVHYVNSFEEHLRCTRLSRWYPLIEDLTPRGKWFDYAPSVAEVATEFKWPIFMKGDRQTSYHQRALSIIGGPDAFNGALRASQQDRILRGQPLVCREFVELRPVEDLFPTAFQVHLNFARSGGSNNWLGVDDIGRRESPTIGPQMKRLRAWPLPKKRRLESTFRSW